jgi:hypothetical protein
MLAETVGSDEWSDAECHKWPRREAEMFRVIGVRSNGERVAISRHHSRDVAESAVQLIESFSGYSEAYIEDDGISQETHPLGVSPLLASDGSA